MAVRQNTMESGLSRQERLALKNKRLGLLIFQISWIMVFICLVVVHAWVRGSSPTWPPPGVEKLGAVLPTATTLALLLSGLFVRRGVSAVRTDRQPAFLANWRIALLLGAAFVAVMAFEWLTVPVSGQYSNLFRVLVGFHGVHALAIGIYLLYVYRHGRQGAYSGASFWPVEAAAGLWYFVIIAWLLFYVVLYWA